jgi:hypothetical protein
MRIRPGSARLRRHVERRRDLMVEAQATRLVVGKRMRMIERTGVQPNAVRARRPALLDGTGEQMPAQAGTDIIGQQAEVRDFDAFIRLDFKFKKPRRNAGGGKYPRFKFGAIEIIEPFLIRPR